ncbi:hypothetical protein ABK040_013636 [Willaertia magna]
MGQCMSGDKARQQDEKVAAQLENERLKDSEIKLLLLGAGESGKSTLFKQMRIIHDGGYNDHELLGFVDTIHSNVLQSMQALIQASHDLNIPIENPENRQKAARILELQNDSLLNISKVYNDAFANDLRDLWEDAGIQAVYKQRNEYQLLDSTEYFYTNLKRISQKDYIPNHQDVLHCRIKTTGVVQLRFEIDGLKMLLIDSDLFQKKLQERSFKQVFNDFEGDETNLRQCADFIKDKFLKKVEEREQKKIDCRITCATDTEAIKTVFDNVKEEILRKTVLGRTN